MEQISSQQKAGSAPLSTKYTKEQVRAPLLLRITTVPVSLKLLLNGQLAFFKKNGFDVLAVSAGGPEVASLTAEGIPHRAVSMTRMITPLRDLISLARLLIIIRKFRPSIVHTHTPKAGLLGMLAAWLCRVPLRLHTVAGLPLMEARGLKRTLLVATERITYACATNVYPNSKALADYITGNVSPATALKVIGNGSSNGIDTAYFSSSAQLQESASLIRQRYGIAKHDVVFSFVGRIVRDKGVGELIEAFRTLRPTGGNRIFLLLVGPFEQDLDPLKKEHFDFLKSDSRVILPGFQTDVRPWLLASDVFVFPSYREGFPNVVLQACSLEVPCVVSDINGCNEIIRHGETGLIVPVKYPMALAAAMEKLMADPGLRKQLARNARTFVVENFDQQFVWNELLNEYRRLLTRHPGTALD